MITGVIKSWDKECGFGLVSSPNSIPKDIEPILDEAVVGQSLDLTVGDEIKYELGQCSQGWIVSDVLSVESDAG
jgi:cold shock CspA family protein